jgi:hypothetical protein
LLAQRSRIAQSTTARRHCPEKSRRLYMGAAFGQKNRVLA